MQDDPQVQLHPHTLQSQGVFMNKPSTTNAGRPSGPALL